MKNKKLIGFLVSVGILNFGLGGSAQAAQIQCKGYNAGSSSEFGLAPNEYLGRITFNLTGFSPLNVRNGSRWRAAAQGTFDLENAAQQLHESLQNRPAMADRAGNLILGGSEGWGTTVKLFRAPKSQRGRTYPAYSRGVIEYDDGSAILRGYLAFCSIKTGP